MLSVALCLAGCQADPSVRSPASSNGAAGEFNATRATSPASDKPLAYINGQQVTLTDLRKGLLEANGGQLLAERIIDLGVEQRLRERGIKPSPEQVAAEFAILGEYMARTITPDRDEVVRLARALKDRVGPARFDRLLQRNAAMRLLVKDQVAVTPAAVQYRFELDYGPKYEARMIVVQNMRDAERVLQGIADGTPFVELATRYSIDSTASRGGLLPPISPVNENVPDGIRKALVSLKPGEVSQLISTADSFTLLRLERKIERQDVAFDDVKEQITSRVRHDAERRFMEQLGRSFLDRADVVVLDPSLRWSWDARREEINPTE